MSPDDFTLSFQKFFFFDIWVIEYYALIVTLKKYVSISDNKSMDV